MDQHLVYDEAAREAALWARKAEDGGMVVLFGTGSASACVTGGAPYGRAGSAPAREDPGFLRPDAVVDLTECSVRTCAARLSASLAPTRGAAGMTHLVDAVRDRDGGDVTVVLDRLHAARDPQGVASRSPSGTPERGGPSPMPPFGPRGR